MLSLIRVGGGLFLYVFMTYEKACLLRERRTVAMETGCQNIQLCTTILKMAFTPAVVGPLFLFPLIMWLFQMIEGSVIIVLFRSYQRFRLKKRGKSDEPNMAGQRSTGGAIFS